MASSNTERSEAGELTGTTVGQVELERTITHPEGGVVATFVLSSEADERTWVRLEQRLPSAFATAEVGFRKDAAPAEWSVEDGLVRGTGEVPPDGSVEFVLGLKLPDESAPEASFPEPELWPCDEPENPERTETEGPLERDDTEGDGSDEHATEATATDGGTDPDAQTDEERGRSESEDGDGPSVLGNPDGELAACIRKVVDGDETADAPAASGEAATDGGRTPTQMADGDELEAAVNAVESELDDADAEGADDTESPELDLQPPDQEDGDDVPVTDSDDGACGDDHDDSGDDEPEELAVPEDPDDISLDDADEGLEDIDIATSAPDMDAAGSPLGIDPSRDEDGVDPLVDRVERADEADRERLRVALGLDGEAANDATEADAMERGGAVDVRLRNVESRLSAFEAYEDALEAFIEDNGTAEEIGERAAEAAETATELHDEVSDLREELQDARDERDSLREELQDAKDERDSLREEVADLREEISEVRGLRQQLLGALQTPNGGEVQGAPASADD